MLMTIVSLLKLIRKHPHFHLIKEHLYSFLVKSPHSGEELMLFLKQHDSVLYGFLQKNSPLLKTLIQSEIKHKMNGYFYCIYGEDIYPQEFYLMDAPPVYFMYLGSTAWLSMKNLAVVGSREPSLLTQKWLQRELSYCLEQIPLTIVSGGARGVDQMAHSIAIRKNLPTVVVVPSGLGSLYPSSLHEWVDIVRDRGGCIISEYDYDQKMIKYHFHDRNRLIAALSQVVLIAEAREKSGTMITAHHAAHLNRPVLVIPSHPLDPQFAGSLNLLAEGATLLRDAQELISVIRSEMSFVKDDILQIGVHCKEHY